MKKQGSKHNATSSSLGKIILARREFPTLLYFMSLQLFAMHTSNQKILAEIFEISGRNPGIGLNL